MSRDKQTEIEEMKTVINGAFFTDFKKGHGVCIGTISAHLYDKGYRKASKVARNIFGNLRILAHIDFDGNICIRKDSFEELEKIYTEGRK